VCAKAEEEERQTPHYNNNMGGSNISHIAPPPAAEQPALQKGGLRISQGLVAQVDRDGGGNPPPPAIQPPLVLPPPPPLLAPSYYALPPPPAADEERLAQARASNERAQREYHALLTRLRQEEAARDEARKGELELEKRVVNQIARVKASLPSAALAATSTQQSSCDRVTDDLLKCLHGKTPTDCADAVDAFEACMHKEQQQQ
jgi:hypothetical protein